MEKPKASTRKPKTSLCMPRFRGNAGNIGYKNKGLSPMTLLERFREAVFRLIMLSALSKASATNNHAGGGGSADVIQPCCYYPNDPHHSEAVADCIEFIKKKASADDENDHQNRDSSASSSSSIHAAPEAVMPVPGLSCNSPT
jgi:hypothetical protein